MTCPACSAEAVPRVCPCGTALCDVCMAAHRCAFADKPLWPHQARCLELVRAALRAGHRAVVVCSPTGSGKSRVMFEIARLSAMKGRRVCLYTSRRILTGQMKDQFEAFGVDFGVMAAGHEELYEAAKLIQVCSVQTVAARALKRERWRVPPADIVLIDEGHENKEDVAAELIRRYKEAGGVVLTFTATPVGLGRKHTVNGRTEPLYSKLVVAARMSELLAHGCVVPCDAFSPDEPDMKGVKRNKVGEYVHEGMVRRVMETIVFGNVFDWWRRLNPAQKPTLLWAPGVPESRWFAEQFRERGVEAAHLDGETPDDERREIFRRHKDGHTKVVSSFGVLRVGADLPWAEHGILVQVCGTLSGYVQLVGRLLRAHPGKARAMLQDHSGAVRRHGDPNADQEWSLEDTDRSLAARRKERLERGEEREPVRCPKCGGERTAGPSCPHCGHQHVRSVRVVRMTDGKLRKVVGSVVKRKRQGDDDEAAWRQCLFAAGHGGRTLAQARADFRRRTGRPLPDGLPNVPPPDSVDWGQRVRVVFPWTVRRKTTT